MIWRRYFRPLLGAGLAACLLAWAMPAVFANEAIYCLTCKGPDQTYRCQVTGVGARANDAVKLYCIVRTAKEGGHASCSADRGTEACQGPMKVYSYDGPAIPPEIAADPRVQGLADRISRDQETFDKPQAKGPKTMVEVGSRAVSASRQGLRNARSRFGGTSQPEETAPLPAPPPAQTGGSNLPSASEDLDRPNRVRRAGSAVGGFARKSYRCMASLFRNCR
ncbi:MAG: hypothetical protein ACOYB4_02515, partial [Methyloceanibacter sp.]